MKYYSLLLFLVFSSCIGTDEVDDMLTSIEIIPPNEVEVVNGNFAKLVGETAQVTAQASSDLGGTFILSDVNWISSDTDVVSVNEEGVLSALNAGTSFLTARYQEFTSEAIMVSVASDLTTVALVQISSVNNVTVINPGESLQLMAAPLNADGQDIEAPSVTWSSSDQSIASVDQNGLVTTSGEGIVRISAMASGVTGFLDLMVGSTASLSRTGNFEGLNGYSTSGEVTLESGNDGSLSLVLGANFNAQNGPGLYLYLSNSSTTVSGGVELGALRSVNGGDVFPVPRNVALDQFNHVVLYCKPFGVGFGTAELRE